ncbi:MAG: hypothetical protein JWN17_1688, partial [Frankiales bacterium]|nr:hypothetical protein [Frankiales bacterium]
MFVQRPGLLVPDTKLDLAVDPVGLLARGLHLWDPQGGAGELQNQAYGYLFPMGPFFALLQEAGLPPWAVQRLWQALVLVVAFLGVRALAARLGLGTPGTRLLAATAYALAPRPLAQLGAISVEVWPYALAPWVLVPLVTGSLRGSPRRAALRSGLTVLCVGGVNAAATLAVVPLGVLWLATRAPGPRRRALSAWWAVAVALASAWWLGPLLLLGKYSPPFLDVIESAATTTRVTGLWGVLTGNDLWQQYLAVGGEPVRPAGFLLVTVPSLVVCTTAVAALGLVALLRRTTPHRGFLASGVLLGVVVVAAGHVGLRPAGGVERDLLDAALAPFRNVHKYDLLLRLPLCLGLASLAAEVRRPQLSLAVLRQPAAGLVALALVGSAAPLVRLQPPGAFPDLPSYWQETADWLADRAPDASGRALLVPAAQSGTYSWGRPGDEPLQPLARSPWVVRDAVPLGGPGTTRVLDQVEEVLQSGRGSAALAPFLGRAGVRYVVVRNDLDVRVTGVRPAVVHASLAASGLERVAAFGPDVGIDQVSGQGSVDGGLSQAYPAVEVFAVEEASGLVSALPRAGTQRVSGGPESLLPLLDAGVVTGRTPVRLAGEDPLPGEQTELRTVTDGYRDRETNVGRASDPAGATLGSDVDLAFDRPVHDYLPVPAPGHRTTAQVTGFAAVTASSSAAQADAVLARGRDHHPTAAFDGNGSTSWVTGGLEPDGQWVQARTAEPVVLQRVRVVSPLVVGSPLELARVRLTTDTGSVSAPVRDGKAVLVPPPGATTRVRLTVEAVTGPFGPARYGALGLDAVVERVGGARLTAERLLRVPADAA